MHGTQPRWRWLKLGELSDEFHKKATARRKRDGERLLLLDRETALPFNSGRVHASEPNPLRSWVRASTWQVTQVPMLGHCFRAKHRSGQWCHWDADSSSPTANWVGHPGHMRAPLYPISISRLEHSGWSWSPIRARRSITVRMCIIRMQHCAIEMSSKNTNIVMGGWGHRKRNFMKSKLNFEKNTTKLWITSSWIKSSLKFIYSRKL